MRDLFQLLELLSWAGKDMEQLRTLTIAAGMKFLTELETHLLNSCLLNIYPREVKT
jgi:hypothetical protein